MPAPIVIVGAGFGGLCAAVELARRGESVRVLERASAVGGKARAVPIDGTTIDVGPTVLTMRWVFDELFASAGAQLDRAVELRALDVIARHSFADGSTLDLFRDIERTAAAIDDFAGPREAAAYRRFAAYSADIARTVEEPFVRSPKPSFASLIRSAGKLGFRALARIDATRTMWSSICSFFEDPRLRALFARYATYVGSSPFEARATFNLIAHVEREGVATVDGGISRLALAVAELARSLGVEIAIDTTVDALLYENGRVAGVEVLRRDGEREKLAARAVIVNADIASVASGILGRRAAAAVDAPSNDGRSLSALTWAISGAPTGFALAHHNVFFSASYENETRQLWSDRKLPDDPTVYLCAQDRGRLFVIVNAPAKPLTTKEIHECEQRMMARLLRAGLDLAPTGIVRMTPATFEALAPGTGGAIYGEAAHGPFAALARPGSRTKIPGLYLAGGSIHPGPGVPMAALSGRLAASALIDDLASTTRSRHVAIAGSTSTS